MRWTLPLVVFCGLALPTRAPAWHKDGHMAVARIAWQQLDQKQKDWATRILKAHAHDGLDHYQLFLTAGRPTRPGEEIPVDEWAFARAAAWPDWVRDPRRETPALTPEQSDAIRAKFHRGGRHFVNLPLAHPADAGLFDAQRLADLTRKALEPEFKQVKGVEEPQHALAALKQALGVLRGGKAEDPDKAVALCWLLHLVGDLHQPLHAATLLARAESLPKSGFDPAPDFAAPGGDEGGNRLAVRLKDGDERATVLHFFWDSLVFDDEEDFAKVEAQVQALLRDPGYRSDQFPELKSGKDFLDWARESLALAKDVAYREKGTADSGFLPATPLPVFRNSADQERALLGLKAPVLLPEYREAARKVGERRIVLAGYRLADQIKAVVP